MDENIDVKRELTKAKVLLRCLQARRACLVAVDRMEVAAQKAYYKMRIKYLGCKVAFLKWQFKWKYGEELEA